MIGYNQRYDLLDVFIKYCIFSIFNANDGFGMPNDIWNPSFAFLINKTK